jgi:hypothetical protein
MPVVFTTSVTLLASLVAIDRWLKIRIKDESAKAWHQIGNTDLLQRNWIFRLRTSAFYVFLANTLKQKIAPNLFGVSFSLFVVYLVLAIINRVMLITFDAAGVYCKPTYVQNQRLDAQNGPIRAACSTADRASGNCEVETISMDGTRTGCDDQTRCTGRVFFFDSRDVCVPTGIFVQRSYRYEVTVSKYKPSDQKEFEWRFAGAPSDPGFMTIARLGVPGDLSGRLRQVFGVTAYLFKRTLDRPLGTVILRFGNLGSEEDFVDPDPDAGAMTTLSESFRPTLDGELFIYLNKPMVAYMPELTRNINSGYAQVRVTRIPR